MDRWFGTQGGGKAVEHEDWYIWAVPPQYFPEMLIGDWVPDDWGITGPFDREGQQIRELGEY